MRGFAKPRSTQPARGQHLRFLLDTAKAAGPLVHDGRVAAICRAAAVAEIWTADRDYSPFAGLPVRNPLPG